MNLKQLKYVQVLAKQGSFSKAAEELNISQPSLSQYIRKIEDELGLELFDRTGNNVRLTDAGMEYTAAGRKIIDIEHQLMLKFDDLRDEKTGSVRIGVSPYRSMCILPVVIAEFRKKYPNIQVIIDERVGQELTDGAERGEYDLCICQAPVNNRLFESEEMYTDECVMIVPLGSELDKELKQKAVKAEGRAYPAIDLKALERQQFVTLYESQHMQRILTEVCAEYGITVKTAVTCTGLSSVLNMVRAGVGSAMVPLSLVKYDDHGVGIYSINQETPLRDIVVAYRKGQVLNGPLTYMVELLKKI